MQRRVLGSNFQCGLKLSNGRIEISFLQVGCAQVTAIPRVFRAQPQGSFELGNGIGGITNLDQRQS